MRRGATADAEFEATAAEMVEHAHLLRQPQRVVGGQQIDQRAEPEAAGALGEGGDENAGRGRGAERRRVVFAHVIAVKAELVIERCEAQTMLILLGERQAAAVILVEDAELHGRVLFGLGRVRR